MMRGNAARTRRTLKWLAHAAVFPVVESSWAVMFVLAGILLRSRTRERMLEGRCRVLVIAPHPDDETLGCGGTIARHLDAGDQVRVLIVTDGGGSRAGGIAREEMRRLRALEAERAGRELGGVDLVQPGMPEGRWSERALQLLLEAQLLEYRPDLVYTTSCVDYHPEHRKVAKVLANALKQSGETSPRASKRPKVRIYEVQVPLTPVLANVVVDTSGVTAARKARALDRYRTQQGSFAWVPRHARYLRHLYRAPGPVEIFWEIDVTGYCKIMEACNSDWMRFRSVRVRPFGDGLAWLVGMKARRRLRRLVEK